jgi:hypothetical protein
MAALLNSTSSAPHRSATAAAILSGAPGSARSARSDAKSPSDARVGVTSADVGEAAGVARDAEDARALAEEQLGGLEPDAARRARDDDATTFEFA